MNQHHRINLSTAWEPPSAGTRAWVRRFGSPSGVEPGDRVWLVVEGGNAAALVLNGVCLPAESARHDVTALLESRNELLLVSPAVAEGDPKMSDDPSSPAASHGRRDLDRQLGHLYLELETAVS